MPTITGTTANDTITGSRGDDAIFGLAGDDRLDGALGSDSLWGGSGNDALFGGSGEGGTDLYGTPHLAYTGFGNAQGWNSQNVYPRMLGDVNGDGRDDAVAFDGGQVWVAPGLDDGTFGMAVSGLSGNFGANNGWTSSNVYPRTLGDVNGDGRDDVVAFGGGNVWVALGQANSTFGTAFVGISGFFGTSSGWSSNNVEPRTVGDVNGDGRADIVGFGVNNVWVALGQANGSFGTSFIAVSGNFGANSTWTTQDQYPRMLGDVNGDGRSDIVAFGGGHTWVALGQANGTFGTAFIATSGVFDNSSEWVSYNVEPRMVADVNGDGRDDVIGIGVNNVWVAYGQSDGTFGTAFIANPGVFGANSGWPTQEQTPRAVGDVNGDGRADIVGFGSDGTRVVLLQTGADVLYGESGDDVLSGGLGADTLFGGTGNDTYVIDDTGVFVIENAGEGSDAVCTSLSAYTLGANVENLSYTGAADFTGVGNGIANRLLGGAGNDTLSGVAGDDTLSGGAGGDLLAGGDGVDWAAYDASSTGITVSLLAGTASGGEAAGDTLTGIENLRGSAFADTLTGDGGANALAGGEGNDLLRGGLGNDTLTGGAGNDLFRFDVADVPNGVQADVVTDFTIGQDRIDYRDWGYNVNGSNAETYEWWRVRGVQILDDGDDVLITAYGGAYTLRLVGVDHAAFMSTGEANYLFL